jgi:hypothetical protein|tara:strand:+ start:1033 stop:1203 length:171 start_codon:yes stop_codon:yes gene_type:complete
MDYLNTVSAKIAESIHAPEVKKFDTNSNPEVEEKKKKKPKLTELFQIKKKDKNKKY